MLIDSQSLETIQKLLAQRLKALRAMKSWKQIDLAVASGRSLSAIAQIETGKIWPTPETIKALADALEVDQEQLFIDSSKKKSVTSEQVRAAVQDVLQLLGEFPVDIMRGIRQADDTDLASIRDILKAGQRVKERAEGNPPVRPKKSAS